MFLFWRNVKYIINRTKAFDHEKPILFFNTENFRSPVRYFVTRMVSQPERSRIPETSSIRVCQVCSTQWPLESGCKFSWISYRASEWYATISESKRIFDTPETFVCSSVAGVEEFAIVHGIYIAPGAKSLIQKNRHAIQKMNLDTTWMVAYLFTCSIMMLSIRNIEIPIALSFGPVEDTGLHDRFWLPW
jgi:hypothetical protein